ncbi:unnamed protein product [Auanema sp. JU1783]|nr:unnamed protein product [Auanema sp. JU1783]
MSLWIDKPDTLQREKVHIKARQLKPFQTYKMIMRLKHKYGAHAAYAVFKADASGEIDVPSSRPLRGTYFEADPMGLFLSQTATPEFDFGGYLRCSPPVPFVYRLELYDDREVLIDTLLMKKHWMHPNLTRTEIEENGFCGTLFKPPGDGPFPCVIDISGTGGGLHEHKGAMLASEGFLVLSLAFFQYKSLVSRLEEVDISYFKKAIDWLISRPDTVDFIGIQGVSFGATIVDILSTRFPEIKVVVSINGPFLQNRYCTLRENGVALQEAELDQSKIRFINRVLATDHILDKLVPTPETIIPFDRVAKDVAYRFVASTDDLVNNSLYASRQKIRQLRESGHNKLEIDIVSGGHIMEPPYFPHHHVVYAKNQGFYCGYGGEVLLHCRSQEQSWLRTISFFSKHLGTPLEMPDWDRELIIAEPTPYSKL